MVYRLRFESVKKNSERVSHHLMAQSRLINWKGLTFPVKVCSKEIDHFEKMNVNIAVNVFGYEYASGGIYPLRISKRNFGSDKITVVRLLLITAHDETAPDKQHYCLIKDMS